MASKRYTLKDGTKLTETQVDTLLSLNKRGEQNVRWYHAMAVKVLRNESMIAGYKQIRITERGIAALRELGLIAAAAPQADESASVEAQLDDNQRQLLHIVNQEPALQELFAEMGMSTKSSTHTSQPAPAGEAFEIEGGLRIATSDSGIQSRCLDVKIGNVHTMFLEADVVGKHLKQAQSRIRELEGYIGHDESMFGYAPPIGETWKSACADAHNDALALTAQLQTANERIRELEVDKQTLIEAITEIGETAALGQGGWISVQESHAPGWTAHYKRINDLCDEAVEAAKKGQS